MASQATDAALDLDAAPDLSAVSTDLLVAELKRRDHVALPRGLLELAIANAKAEGVKDYETGKVDAGPVLDQLGRLAGEDLPAAVALVKELNAENRELHRRTSMAEAHFNALVSIATGEIERSTSED